MAATTWRFCDYKTGEIDGVRCPLPAAQVPYRGYYWCAEHLARVKGGVEPREVPPKMEITASSFAKGLISLALVIGGLIGIGVLVAVAIRHLPSALAPLGLPLLLVVIFAARVAAHRR